MFHSNFGIDRTLCTERSSSRLCLCMIRVFYFVSSVCLCVCLTFESLDVKVHFFRMQVRLQEMQMKFVHRAANWSTLKLCNKLCRDHFHLIFKSDSRSLPRKFPHFILYSKDSSNHSRHAQTACYAASTWISNEMREFSWKGTWILFEN